MVILSGRRVLTVMGSNMGEPANDSRVYVGKVDCNIELWTSTNVTCLLPVLPPGLHDVHVQVGNKGYAQTRYHIKVIWKLYQIKVFKNTVKLNCTLAVIISIKTRFLVCLFKGHIAKALGYILPFKANKHSWLWILFGFHSNGLDASIEYVLEVHSISPTTGSLMGGTQLTISGSGFSQNVSDNKVYFGKQYKRD